MPAALKLKPYPGVRLIASETLEAHATEQALRAAQHEYDVKHHDLQTEFIARENELRREHRDRVAEIAAP